MQVQTSAPHVFQDEIEHQKKADYVVDTVLKLMDKNGDGKVTPEEFEAAGFKGLPSFDDIGAEGHHYDVESGASFPESVFTPVGSAHRSAFATRVFPPPRRYVFGRVPPCISKPPTHPLITP